jgi:hypothetical protein
MNFDFTVRFSFLGKMTRQRGQYKVYCHTNINSRSTINYNKMLNLDSKNQLLEKFEFLLDSFASCAFFTQCEKNNITLRFFLAA